MRKAMSKTCDGNALDQLEFVEDGNWRGDVIGANSKYIFKLTRSSDARPWAIVEVKESDDEARKKAAAIRKEVCHALMLSPVAPFLPSLVQGKGFHCTRADTESVKGEDLVRVVFSFAGEGKSRLKSGWIILDPSRYWVIRQSEVEASLGGKAEGIEKWTFNNDYRDGPNRFPIATKTMMTDKAWEKGRFLGETELITEYTFRERPSIPEEEFTLSAFDLPEPHWARPKKTPWYLWFGSLGIGCLVVGACVRQFKRRQAVAGA
ncbi:MAG: hypothetical protein U0797_08830 [Gemmataceae bacterium]